MRILSEKYRWKWYFLVNKLVHAYISSPNDITGYSPFQLMVGRPSRSLKDALFSAATPKNKQEYSAYEEEWKQAIPEAHKVVQEKKGN